MAATKQKRVLLLAPLLGAGGVETHLLRLSRLLVAHGAEVTLAARVVQPGVPIVGLRDSIPVRFISTPFAMGNRAPRLSMAWALHVWPRRLPHDFDVLFSFEASRLVAALAGLVKNDGHVICMRVGNIPRDLLDPQAQAATDGFIVESPMQAAQCGVGVSIRVIPLLGNTAQAPAWKPRQPGPLRVGYLGRYEQPKGIFRLLDVWPQVDLPGARLVYCGQGPHREELEREIQRRGLADQVEVHGGWTEPQEASAAFARVDLCVLPSDTEGFPVILLEAMAHGVPFVATDVGAVRTFAEDNLDVAVVPLDNAALAQAITELGRRILSGEVRGDRLQGYYRERYAAEKLERRWLEALLSPETFWATDADPRTELAPSHRS